MMVSTTGSGRGAPSSVTRQHGLFSIMSLVWGLTWVAVRTGVDVLPPFFFAAVRLLIAAVAIVAFILWATQFE